MATWNCRVEGNLAIDGVSFRNTSASLPQVSPGQQPLVQASSQCLWTGAHEPLSLSWEAIISGTYHGNASINGQHLRVATCDNTNADTGADTFDGVRIGGYFKTYASQIPTKVLACPQSGSNPLGDCRDLHQDCIDPSKCTCQDVTDSCSTGQPSNYPFCAEGCVQTPSVDTAYEVQPIGFMPLNVTPNFYRVQGMRTLARKLTFSSDRNAFLFPANPDAPLVDNFSPYLMISRIRAFVPSSGDPASTPQYLRLGRVQVARHSIGSPTPLNFATICGSPDADDLTQITIKGCPALKSEVPTYSGALAGSENVLFTTWKVELPMQSVATGPVDQNSTVFVEFTLVDTSEGSGGLKARSEPAISPATYSFNNVLPGTGPQIATAAFTITNDPWTQTWTVDSIGITGANPSDFSTSVHGSRTPPFNIDPLDSFSIDVTLKNNTPGSKSGTLGIAMHSASGRNLTLTGAINAYPIAPLEVEPQSIYFNFGNQALPWRRAVLIVNNGPWPVTLGRSPVPTAVSPPGGVVISSSGADQFAFRTYALDGTSPVASVTLSPGQSEVIYVYFCPSTRGRPLNAQLNVIANVSQNQANPVWATSFVPLQGYVSTSLAACIWR